jgi:nitrogen fixation protein NifB
VAVATTGDGMVNQHFGRAREFWIYEAAPGRARFIGIRRVPRSCGGPATCGAPSDRLTDTVGLLGDCAAVLCSKIGPQPHGALTAAGIEPVEVTDLIEPAVAQVGAGLATRERQRTAGIPAAAGRGSGR